MASKATEEMSIACDRISNALNFRGRPIRDPQRSVGTIIKRETVLDVFKLERSIEVAQ